jgi:nucleotide-binding universal stress UspA family protein
MSDFRTFVVPYDFSEHARAALHVATDLARRLESDVHLVHVIQSPSLAYVAYGDYGTAVSAPVDMLELREIATNSLRDVAAGIDGGSGKIELHVVEGTSVVDAIRESAQQLDADLIVMGTHGRTGLAHVFIGSVAERTLRRAPCPVLTVRAPEGAG